MARPDFRAAAARRLSEDRELSPAIVSLLSPESTDAHDRRPDHPARPDRAEPGPAAARFDARRSTSSPASIREHGVLQPILVRPLGANRYQLIAGERRWRASKLAGLDTIPALVEDIDDDTALEISIIENLQREDLSPLDEAAMYDRMIHEHGYSIRKLAEKLGKDKGYLENRLRLADAPDGDPRAGVLAQRHPLARLRADEGRGPEEAPEAGRPGRPRRAVAGQAPREDRGPPRPPGATVDADRRRGRDAARSDARRARTSADELWT